MRLIYVGAFCFGLAVAAPPVHAYCSYDGVMYAKTTVAQEFADSQWVAKVRVISAVNHFGDDEPEPWTLYRLQVVESYKGRPPASLKFFTGRNSGGFYFEKPFTGADIGGEYLVFLNANEPYAGQPAGRRGTVFVNYACGQSKPWADVTTYELQTLQRLRTTKAPRL